MLRLEGVDRTFRGGVGVRDLALHVAPGEVVALVGLNGAGKTTLMRLALGMLRPDRGSVRVLGRPVTRLPAPEWRHVGALVDTALAYPELTVRENLRATALLRGTAPALVAEALAKWDLHRSPDAATGGCPAVPSSGWAWRRRSSTGRGFSSSTSRAPPSTRPPSSCCATT